MPYCRFYHIKIGAVIICRIIRHEDSPATATIIMWEKNIKHPGTNEQIFELAKTMLPAECRPFATITEEK